MWKAWLNLWKNTFCYTGSTPLGEYWQALIMNVLAMYVGIIPYCLIIKNLTDNVTLIIALYMVAVHLPVLSLYFRRARNAGWKVGTAIYLAVVTPVLSGLIVGAIHHCGAVTKGHSFLAKIFALSFGLCFYGSIVSLILYDDPTAIEILPISGLLLASGTLIIYGIVNWRQVLAFWLGSQDT